MAQLKQIFQLVKLNQLADQLRHSITISTSR